MRIKKGLSYFILIVFAAIIFACGSDDNDSSDIEYNYIKEYYIECDIDEFNQTRKTYKQNIYIPIKISFNGDTVIARMRIRGDTSREDPKKSLKIRFDSTQIDALPEKLNLNAEYADKTYIRQYISTLMMKKSGQACYNSQHVKVYLNGNFYGLYLQVENMDKDFLVRNCLDPSGNLYKATKDGACLSIFDDFEKKWEKKTNKKSDYNDLLDLIDKINHTPDDEFESFVKETFEYEKLVNMLALNMLLSNNSTYYHNYYLYHDLYNTGKWQMFPWDMDKTLSYYNWMPYTYHKTSSEWESDNPLVERSILCKPIFEDIRKRITELHKSHMNNITMNPIVDSLTGLLKDIIPLDTTDKITDEKEWFKRADLEKSYFDNHYKLLQKQFNEQPHSFNVYRFNQLQTGLVTFKWDKANHPSNKEIKYILTYGTDFLLQDSSRTNFVTNISDTFYTIRKTLPEGKYYWKITAFDGEYYTDGFNTKNIFEVKKGANLPSLISSNLTLTKDKSPYVATKTTTIKKGSTLTIEKGVEIHFPEDATIECSGNFYANGTKEEPIVLQPQNTTDSWGHIYFYEPCQKAYLNNVIFREGTINCKAKSLTLDSCKMFVEKKDIGQGGSRKVLIYTNETIAKITNSEFISNGFGEGMVLFYSDVTTENCYFDNTPDAIEYIGSNNGIIRNNYVTNSPDDAIDLNKCNNVLIEGNILMYNVDKAISIGTEQYGASLKNIQIKNNLIVKNKTAIAIKDSSVAYMSNNTLFKNKYGINAYKKRDDYPVGGVGFVKNTIFEKNEETNAYPDEYSDIKVSHSIVNNKILAGKNNIQGDPMFIDASNNNFHLREESICKGKGDDGNDLGAFQSTGTTVGLAKIHIKSSKENKTGDYIEIINHYNIPVDLSLYKIKIIKEDNEAEFVFPIGTMLDRMGRLVVANKYYDFTKLLRGVKAIGGLPKLNSKRTSIILYNKGNDVLDKFSYDEISKDKEDLTYVSNCINDFTKRKWKLEAK